MRVIRTYIMLALFSLFQISSFSMNSRQPEEFKFRLLNHSNKPVTEQNFSGKITLLNFGTLDSEASLKEKILLERFLNENNQLDINFVPIIIGNSKEISDFIKMNKFSYNFYTNPDNSLKNRLDVNIIPSTYILNRRGVLVYKHVGILNFEELKRILDLLNKIYSEDMYGAL